MTEDQKEQTVQRNQVGKKQSFPIIQDNDDNQSDSLKKSSGSEEEQQSTVEISELEDTKHPHKQGVPISSQEQSERSF